MKKKTIVKITLDVAMIITIALMYSKQALGLAFHEIGGLILIGVFFIHKGLNFSWIRRVTARLGKTDGRTRLMWIVDALMLAAFLAVGVSGLLISKIAFPGLAVSGGPWKALHYGCAALALILTGVHMGLHVNYLKGTLGRRIRLNRAAAAALIIVIAAYGAYGMAATSFARWLAMPFSTTQQGGEGFRGGRGGEALGVTDESQPSADALTGDASAQPAADASQSSDSSLSRGQTGGQGPDGGHGQSGSAFGALGTLAQYFSIAFAFSALTALIDRARRRRRRAAV